MTSKKAPLRVFTLASIAIVSTLAIAGCAAEPDAHEEEPVRAPPDPHAVKASEETRQALGVATWGVRREENAIRMAGYDAKGRARVVVMQRSFAADSAHLVLDLEVTGELASGHLRLDGVVGVDEKGTSTQLAFEATENTFEGSPRAKLVLDRLDADFTANTSAPTALVVAKNQVGPQALLTGECMSLLGECGSFLLATGRELLPCVTALRQVRLLFNCGQVGAVIGGVVTAPTGPGVIAGAAGGALAGVGICGLIVGDSLEENARMCAAAVEDLVNGMEARDAAIDATCGEVARGCPAK